MSKLSHIASECGAVIAVEDLPRTCLGRDSDEILQLISVDEKLRVCFDTKHLLTENNADFIRKVGSKIITLHVSDYDFINERHWLPGEGKVDWNSLLDALQEIGYNGMWLYEVAFKSPKTIIRERDLTCEDFVKNAKELFLHKKLSVFCKHIKNLGF